MVLSKLNTGAQFRVLKVNLDQEVGRRLADMGFVKGVAGAIIRKRLFGGPLEVKIMDYEVLLRASEAAGIEVDELAKVPIAKSTKPNHERTAQAGDTTAGKAEKNVEMKRLRVALAGNPNSGKTTLFNTITGSHLHVGNYPGVTVEKREGKISRGNIHYTFTDLPGIYSLSAYSEDEVVSRDFLIKEKPDCIIDILDSTNLVRNLNLTMQLQELGVPVIGALNIVEEAESKGIQIDEKTLSASLHIPFIKINAKTGKGLEKLYTVLEELKPSVDKASAVDYGEEIEKHLAELEDIISRETQLQLPPSRWFAVKLLEKDSYTRMLFEKHTSSNMAITAKADAAIGWLEKHFAASSEIIMAEQRFAYIRGAVKESVKEVKEPDFSLTDKIDKVVMNRVLVLPLFVFMLYLIFQLTFTIGAYPQSWLEYFFIFLGDVCNKAFAKQELLRSLLVDGIIAGVGGVLSFVPLIVLLFFFLSILEDLGYMSRAAFATDKLLHSFGLHGQSIFPMMLGFGCSVPAIMASRTLKSKRDRIITVLVTPMMSCGAKLPVHMLFAVAFFGKSAGNMVMLVYACGVVLSLAAAYVLKHTVLQGNPTPFVLELPPYRLPTLRGICYHVWEKTWSYIKRAGGIILFASIIVWFFTTFPVYKADKEKVTALQSTYFVEYPAAENEEMETYIENAVTELQLANSFAGRAGQFIEPLFKPLGFNWKMSVAILTGFVGKEIVVSTLSVLYRGGGETSDGDDVGLQIALNTDPTITPLIAFTFMIFMLLIPPCFAALATIKAELGWRWLGFEFVFLFVIGWICSFAVFHIGGGV
jgi:ferrous iron transport protein B